MRWFIVRLPNGYGSVFKLKGNRRKPFVARKTEGFNEKGHPIYNILGYFEKSQDAMMTLASYNADPYDMSNRDLTFSAIYELWVKRKYTDNGKEITSGYRAARNACSDKFVSMKFIDIRAEHMQKELNNWDKSYASKSNMKILFGFLFSLAMENDLVKKDYSKYVKLESPEEKSDIHKAFTKEELVVLWKNTDDIAVKFALILCYTGLRPTELLKIETANVHLDKRYMRGGIKTKAGKNRAIPISEKIFKFIEELYNPKNKFLIEFENKPLSYPKLRNYYWDPLMQILNMDHLPHDGRHTCATMLDNVVINKLLTKKILGHAVSDETEKTYTHKTIQQLVDAINMI
jgi:integrase